MNEAFKEEFKKALDETRVSWSKEIRQLMNEEFIKALNEADLSLPEFLEIYSNEVEELIETGHCDLTVGNNDKVWKLYLTIKE
jgi:hypothetical protein